MSRSVPTLVSRFAAQARRWRFLGLIGLLGLFFAQAAAASPYHSVTFDEQYHVTPGYVYLKTGDLRFHHDQNPPLFEAIISLPLLLRTDLNLPLDHPAYALWGDVYLFSDDFLWHANPDAQSIVHTGRLVVAGFGVLLGLLLFVWGKQLYGERAGWVAAFLLAFDPNFIANAIPTLDLGLAFTSTLAMWRLWHYLKRPTKLNVTLAGLALGFALATKFLSVMLLPSFVLVLLIYPFTTKAQRLAAHRRIAAGMGRHKENLVSWWLRGELARRAIVFAVMLLLAYLVLWITYRFQFGPVSGAGWPIPAPQYFESFIGMFLKSSEGRANFLLGQTSVAGWPYYFVVAFLIKTPLPTLLFILAALIRWPYRREWRASSLLILPALFFFGSASISQLQLGYRYLLPVLPFLFLMVGRVVQDIRLSRRSRWIKIVPVGLAAWLVIGTVAIFPHDLSYFNESIGGPANGYKYLVDSNVDWGQDLPALKVWLEAHPANDLRLGFFGSAYPDHYGIQAIGLPGYPLNAGGNEVNGFTSYSLEPGRYALSATLLRIGLVSKQFNLYAAFQAMTPIDRVGYSILVYDVKYPPDAEVDRAVISGPLASDVPPEALGYRPDHPLRAKWCANPQCVVLTPHPARYIVPDTIPFSTSLTIPAQQQAKLIQTLTLPNGSDPSSNATAQYKVLDLDATSIIQSGLSHLQASPAFTSDSISTTYPITFDNGLAFVGYEANGLTVNTYWRVTDRLQPPLKIFVHLLDAQGSIVGQNDSFGAATQMLEPGDVVLQHHPLTLKDGTPPGDYRLEIGLYNPVTRDRFKAHPLNLPDADHILLSSIQVRTPAP